MLLVFSQRMTQTGEAGQISNKVRGESSFSIRGVAKYRGEGCGIGNCFTRCVIICLCSLLTPTRLLHVQYDSDLGFDWKKEKDDYVSGLKSIRKQRFIASQVRPVFALTLYVL